MKVCRMCWTLLDDQLDNCNCIQGAHGIFFKDVAEAINHFVTHERLMSKRARKLEQLVKERIQTVLNMFSETTTWTKSGFIDELQSLVEESEKNE